MRFAPLLTSVISALALLPSANAWGQEGHAVVATIGELYLQPNVLPTLCSILNSQDGGGNSCSLASVASWADQIKRKMRWSAPLHYVNPVADHPPQHCIFPGAKGWEGQDGANVLAGIRNTTDILNQWVHQGSDPSDPLANEALRFLIHFVGDLHMPFHLAGRLEGANGVSVRWGRRKVKLHGMWDTELVERAVENTPSQWDQPLSSDIESHLHGDKYDSLVRRILVQGINQTWAGESRSWTQCSSSSSTSGGDQTVIQTMWDPSETDDQNVCPWYWAKPNHQLLCEWAWPKELDQPPYNEQGGPLLELDTDEYGGRIANGLVIEKLLAMGGFRLAAILNLIFAQSQNN